MGKDKVVLAYSGGLDTSVAIKWIMEHKDVDVIAVAVDVGQERDDLTFIQEKALSIGAVESVVLDVRDEFANDFISCALKANGLYEGKYPLLSALSRPIIVKHLVEIAHKYGARYIAHGCTGKGNDQVRFEVGITSLDPTIEIVAPVREWDLRTREQEITWAEERGISVPATVESPYSIDDNLWGRAIECGILENPWVEPPVDIYTVTSDPITEAEDEAEYVQISFKEGVPVALDGQEKSLLTIIEEMNIIAGRNGYGRIDMVENRLVGVKSREVYEAPAALALIQAHKALEDLCLEREVLHYKSGIEQKWATLVYNGLWFSPLKEALDAFVDSTQKMLTGDVRLRFFKGSCVTVGRRSDYSLYDHALATYDEEDMFDHGAAKGFIDLHGLPVKVWASAAAKAAASAGGDSCGI